MVFKGFRVQREFFGQKSDPNIAVWMHDAEIDALFPLNIDRRQQDGFRTSRL
jgi:hypothetical protein